MIKPMLGDLELLLVQRIETAESQTLVDHAVPGLAGNFTQQLNRQITQVKLHGILAGPEARDNLEALRQQFHAAEPLPFTADILAATEVQEMLIADLQAQEMAGKPERFVYRLTLNEYIPPPPDEETTMQIAEEEMQTEATEITEKQTDDVANDLATLEVRVELAEGDDYSGIAVQVEGNTDGGEPFAILIEEHNDGIYRAENIRAGTYTVRAVSR